jgi:hypothetical protein
MRCLPSQDRRYLTDRGACYEEVLDGSQQGVIIRGYALPPGQFDVAQTDVLILLPPGYPDAAPDMFYLLPWVRLAQHQRYPHAADQPFSFHRQIWQRWSRHNTDWRPGVDGIWTMLQRVAHALEVAV